MNNLNRALAIENLPERDAAYDLVQTTVMAPTNGYVTQLFLRPGMMAASATIMIFIHADWPQAEILDGR